MSVQPGANHVDVRYVADLARIALTDEEIARYESQLDDILEYVAKLQELDVSDVDPTAHAAPVTNVFREDIAADCLERETALDNAPATLDDELIRVPVVIEGEEISG